MARYTLLAGGVGAARLLRGLATKLAPQDLDVVVNTADDEEFYGLHVSPDLDTIVYTLAGRASIRPGWGLSNETFGARTELDRLYGPGWFALGDKDLATHIYRTDRLRRGATLTQVTRHIARSYGVHNRIIPMTNDRVRSVIHSGEGRLAFQEYLVKRRARPRVDSVKFRGGASALPAPGVLRSLAAAKRIFIAPSNPFVSIGPILAIPSLRDAVESFRSKTVAISPLIGGRAVKGPLASMLRSQGYKSGTAGIADFYSRFASILIVAKGDIPTRVSKQWPRLVEADTLIDTPPRSKRLARVLLAPNL